MTEGGRVNRISVAVLVDGAYTKNDKGETTYQPREKEEIDRIAALVRTAIGFDQKRGDQTFTKDDVMHWIELGVMLLLALVVLLLVVRPLVRRILESESSPSGAANVVAAIAGGDVQAALAQEIKAVPSQTSKMIDMAQVQGQVHAQSVQKVGELADSNPNETISIIRSWLHENAA